MQPRTSHHGFTLIEMLVTIGIIALLAAILISAVGAAIRRAKCTRCQVQVNDLAAALEAYYREYGRWPVGLKGETDTPSESHDVEKEVVGGLDTCPNVVRMLSGETVNGQNHRRIPFLQFIRAAIRQGRLVDPWGNPYKYMLDFNLDNTLHLEFVNGSRVLDLPQSVAAWSRGGNPDENGPDGWKDDIRSWQ